MEPANNFGSALRGWRDRLAPADAGLDVEAGTGRRARGLRRAELARLAGLSVDYVVRLEQGRARRPSAQVVTALARALRLDPAERDHLFRCANLVPPAGAAVSRHVPVRVTRLVRQLGDTPVAVFAADWTIVAHNPMWTVTLGDPGEYDWHDRNLVAGMFRSVDGRRPDSIVGWPVRSVAGDAAEEQALVADLRATAAAYPADERLAALVDGLVRSSQRFARLWATGPVGPLAEDHKIVEHPVVGDIHLDLDVLMVPGLDLRIVAYGAEADTVDARKLDALRGGI
ncbi:MAG TPA: helix-turn-helix transcriptional regulator [Pseudonocardiaceae bacterium]|jgi:transcriptional regulator with XRE-family HTH domain